MTERHRYSCQQDLAVFHLFLQLMNGEPPTRGDLERLSRAMKNHNAGSVRERVRNFVSASGFQEYPTGFTPRNNAANLTKCIWAKYEEDRERIRAKASAAYFDILGSGQDADDRL